MADAEQQREINRLVRQSWAKLPAGVDLLAQEVAAILDTFINSDVLSGAFARLNVGVPDQSFVARQNFAEGLEVGYAGASSAVSIVHGGGSGYALEVVGRPTRVLSGLEVFKSGTGYAITVVDKPGISYAGWLFTQTTAGQYAQDTQQNVSGTGARFYHNLSTGLALYIQTSTGTGSGRTAMQVDGDFYVTGNIICGGSYL